MDQTVMQKEPVVAPDTTVVGESRATVQEAVITESSPQPAQAELWYEGLELPEGLELSDKDREFATVGDYVKHTHSLRQMVNAKGIIPPGEGADTETVDAFHQALKEAGVNIPVVPESYNVEFIENNEMMTDERKAGLYDGFKQNSMSAEQVEGVLKLFGEQMELDQAELQSRAVEEREATFARFTEEFGDKAKTHILGIERVEKQHPEATEILKQAGLQGNEAILRMLDAVAIGTREDAIDEVPGEARNIDAEIQALKANPKYKDGNAFERQEILKQIEDLYALKNSG